MKLRELIIKLSDYNQESDVTVIANNKSHEFSITYGGSDGVTKKTCESVSFYVDSLNGNERTK